MIVVTTASQGQKAGCLVGFHAQTSIEPRHYAIWLSKANYTYRVALGASHFAVHFLSTDEFALAERFGTQSGADTDKFQGLEIDVTHHGVPQLLDCSHRMLVERIAMLDVSGDHVCVTTRVVSASAGGNFEPLRVSQLAHLEPGHEAEERAIKP